jgi:hypothetical protein
MSELHIALAEAESDYEWACWRHDHWPDIDSASAMIAAANRANSALSAFRDSGVKWA